MMHEPALIMGDTPLPRVKLVRDTFAALCTTCGAIFQDDCPYWSLEKSIGLHASNHGKKAIVRFGLPKAQ